MTNVESLERDVLDCGVPFGDARAVRKRYERAIESGACADWIEFYVGAFVTLLRGVNRTGPVHVEAAKRLLQLFADDLGTQLFDDDARRRLRAVVHTGLSAARPSTYTGSLQHLREAPHACSSSTVFSRSCDFS